MLDDAPASQGFSQLKVCDRVLQVDDKDLLGQPAFLCGIMGKTPDLIL